MSGRVPLRLRATKRPQAPDAALATPWFARPPDDAATPGGAPALFTFDDADFLPKFFAGVDAAREGWGAGAFPPLRPLRDWSEAPRGMLDAARRPRYDAVALKRRPLRADEALSDGGVDASAVLLSEEQGSGLPWLRKLYLPTHRHFHVVAAELVCERQGQPPIDPARVAEVGAVIRRLVPDSEERRRWEDWIPAGERKGTWVVIADGAMNGASGTLDPKALHPTARGETDIRLRLGLAATAPLPALVPIKLMPLPPAQGKGRSAFFAYLPVQSGDLELPLDAGAQAANATTLADGARSNLNAAFQGHAASLEAGVRASWSALLQALASGPEDGGWGADPGTTSTAHDALIRRLWDKQDPPTLANPNPNHTDLAAAPALVRDTARDYIAHVGRLADAIRKAVTAPPGTALAGTTPSFSTVVGEWLAALPSTLPWARAGFLATPRAEVAAFLRRGLEQMLQDVLAAPLGDGAATPAHHLIAATLLWVRAVRVRLVKAQRALLGAAVPAIDALAVDQRTTSDPRAPGTLVPLVTVGSLAGEIEAFLAADEARPTTPRPWPALDRTQHARAIAIHRACAALEAKLAEIVRLGSGGGGGWVDAVEARAGALRGGLRRAWGLDLDGQPEQGLLVLDALHFSATWQGFRDAAVAHYATHAAANANAIAMEAEARQTVIRPRFDPDHLYAVWVYARVRGGDPCVADRILWSARTEPFAIADPMDVLGIKPVPVRLPDLPNLLRDIPRIRRAGALPVAAITTPPDSGYSTGESPKDTARQWGIAWVCSIGIPVFTICAWIAFSIIFSILLLIPGFAWMLLLKICIPLPVPRRGS